MWGPPRGCWLLSLPKCVVGQSVLKSVPLGIDRNGTSSTNAWQDSSKARGSNTRQRLGTPRILCSSADDHGEEGPRGSRRYVHPRSEFDRNETENFSLFTSFFTFHGVCPRTFPGSYFSSQSVARKYRARVCQVAFFVQNQNGKLKAVTNASMLTVKQ